MERAYELLTQLGIGSNKFAQSDISIILPHAVNVKPFYSSPAAETICSNCLVPLYLSHNAAISITK